MIAFILKIIFFPIYLIIDICSIITKNLDKIVLFLFCLFYLIIYLSWKCIKCIYKLICWIIKKHKDSNSKRKSKEKYKKQIKDIDTIDSFNNSNQNNNIKELSENILSNETKICDSTKVERKTESNKNHDHELEINQYDSVMYDYNDMKNEYRNIYYGDHNSAKLNNLICNSNKTVNNKKDKNITQVYKFTHLVLYLNKNNIELIKNDEINCKLLGIDKTIFPYLLLDEYDEDDGETNKYIKFIDDNYTSKEYSDAIFKILEYCKNDTYITLGYEYESYKYKFLYKDGKIILENYNLDNFNNELKTLKYSIINNYNIISNYIFNIKMEDIEMPHNPQPDVHYEDITELIDKFQKNYKFKVTDLPYINEVHSILSYITNKLEEDNFNNSNSTIEFDENKKRNNYEILHNTYSLRIYLSNTFKNLINIKKDEINYKELGIEELHYMYTYIDDQEYRFVIHVDELSNKDFSKLLMALFKYCKDGVYAIYGYEDIDEFYKYKFLYSNGEIFIEDYSFSDLKNMYEKLKNEIINTFDILEDKFMYLDDIDVDEINPNSDFDYYDINYLVKKLKECKELSILELPAMEVVSESLKQIQNKIDNLYVKKRNSDLYDTWHIEKISDEYETYEEIQENITKKEQQEKQLSWEEEEFEREADLWGLSKEDRRIAKEERMSPAEFIEAEERDDDELFTDEWEDEY